MSAIFKGPKVPQAPDPIATIEAQKKAQQVAQYTPEGNLIFGEIDPVTGAFKQRNTDAMQIQESEFQKQSRLQRETLATELMAQLGGENGVLQNVRGSSDISSVLPQYGNIGNLGMSLPNLSQDFSQDATRVEQATFDAAKTRLQPEFERQKQNLEQQLADQGLPRGSQAFNEALNRLERSQGDQLNKLSLDAVQAGRQEQSRLTGLASGVRGQLYGEQQNAITMQNALRAQALQEQLGLLGTEQQSRAQRFGEIGNLLGITPQFTQFNTPQVDAAGIINQGYQNQLGQYQLKLQQKQQQAKDVQQMGLLAAGFM
jgi:hypothetical protein